MEQQNFNLGQWCQKHWLRLLLLGIVCAGLLIFFNWLESSVTYRNWQLTFNSPALESLWEIAYRKGKLYIAAPELGESWVFTGSQLSAFRRKYWMSVRLAVANILILSGVFLLFLLFRNRSWLGNNLKQLFNHLLNTPPYKSVYLLVIWIVLFLSFFPMGQFASWWPSFKFISPKFDPGSLAWLVYDLMTEALVYKTQRFFYASLFTVPAFILQLAAAGSFGILILNYCPLPEFMRQVNLKKPLKALSRPIAIIILAGCIFFIASQFLWGGYRHIPDSNENIAHLFQAKIFQQGTLSAPIKHSKEFFSFPYIANDDSLYSQFSPGYSLLLALALTIKASWLLNPLLAVLTVLIAYKLASNLYDRPTAILSAILFAFSPLFIKTASGRHPATALFLCLGLFFYQKMYERENTAYTMFCGVSLGISYIISPLISLAFIIPCVMFLISRFWKQPQKLVLAGLLLFPFLAAVISLAIYNYHLTGEYFVFGYNSLFLAGPGQVIQPLKAGLAHTGYRLQEINYKLIGEWLPVFLFIPVVLFRREKQLIWDKLLAAILLSLLIAYTLFFTNEANFSNFLLGILPFLIILSARGLLLFPDFMDTLGFNAEKVSCLLILILGLNFAVSIKTHFAAADFPPEISQLAEERGIKEAIIFLDKGLYSQGFVHNDPNFENKIIYARNLGRYNYKLQEEFPHRKYYLYQPQLAPGEEFIELSP